ncbi:hypothetical protein Q7P37_011306 [Cladosporium fusiforme]
MCPSPIDPDAATSPAKAASSNVSTPASSAKDPSKFHAIDRNKTNPDIQITDETWLTVLEAACTYGPQIFEKIMLNFIKNPNVTSSHLFRADILYDSQNEFEQLASNGSGDDSVKFSGNDRKPRTFALAGWTQDRVIVRLLVPRNQQLDKPLVQTCILLSKTLGEDVRESLVVYIPHTEKPEDMPFYHPSVQKLAFHHSFCATSSNTGPENKPDDGSASGIGNLSISYNPFASSSKLEPKLQRTALKLLQTIHKHGQGQLAGYEKKVHLDQIIPQKRYQDTYALLKAKYGRKISESWVEVTDPAKHVFEDLGIAAFCLELWRDMYEVPTGSDGQAVGGAENVESGVEASKVDEEQKKSAFPGFVDIGCGNGLLVYILNSEGYTGTGFDARERKTWSIFPPEIRQNLRQSLLVPELLRPASKDNNIADEDAAKSWHSGLFGEGTFIISNHADELTAWTPLLAYLNNSAFIAIPCCSHDLAGSRFRAPDSTKAQKAQAVAAKRNERNEHAARLPQQSPDTEEAANQSKTPELRLTQAAETGSLKKTLVHKKMASAYSTLCAYVEALADAVGFEAEKEVLRIPSTRNQSIIGRRRKVVGESLEDKREKVVALVEEELSRGIENIGAEWIEKAEKLAKKPGSGH